MEEITRPINPYAAPSGRVEDPLTESAGRLPASRMRRLGGAVLDTLLYGIGFIVAIIVMGLPDFANPAWLLLAYAPALPVLVINLYLLWRDGQSLGKKAAGTRIVRKDGSRASLGRIFMLRMLAPALFGFIPILGPFFSLANTLAIFSSARRCLHDYMADTIVVLAS